MMKMDKSKALILASMLVMVTVLGGILLPAYSIDDKEALKVGTQVPPWMQDLTEDQKEDVRALVEEMKEDGASKEEIREAVKAKLEQLGIEVPEFKGPRGKQWMGDLTEDQIAEIRELKEEMKEDGASKEEIREAVLKLLEELE